MAGVALPFVRASAPRCTVELDVADALGAAHSMRTLARKRKLPPGTAEVYERVAAELIRGAHKALPGGGR